MADSDDEKEVEADPAKMVESSPRRNMDDRRGMIRCYCCLCLRVFDGHGEEEEDHSAGLHESLEHKACGSNVRPRQGNRKLDCTLHVGDDDDDEVVVHTEETVDYRNDSATVYLVPSCLAIGFVLAHYHYSN